MKFFTLFCWLPGFWTLLAIFSACDNFASVSEESGAALFISLPHLSSTSPEDLFSEPEFKGSQAVTELTFTFSSEIHPESLSENAVVVVSGGAVADESVLTWALELKEIKDDATRYSYYDQYWDTIDSLKEDAIEKNTFEIVPGAVSLAGATHLRFSATSSLALGNLYLVLLTRLFDKSYTPILPEMISFYFEDENGDAGADGVDQIEYPSPAAGELIINEILADPPAESLGDSNQDGVRDSADDEFLEIVNISDKTLDIAGLLVAVGGETKIKHQFERLPLAPKGCIVLFGGGEVKQGNDECFFLVAQSPLKLINTGTTISLTFEGTSIESVTYDDLGGNDQSLVRAPELSGEFSLHSELPESNGSLFSPGTRVDGLSF